MNDPEIQRKIEKGGRGQLRQDIEDEVQNKEHPGPLRTARRGHEPGHQGQSKAMNPASCREQGSDDRQANTGLECMNTGEQSGAEGPRPEQWTGNNDGEDPFLAPKMSFLSLDSVASTCLSFWVIWLSLLLVLQNIYGLDTL